MRLANAYLMALMLAGMLPRVVDAQQNRSTPTPQSPAAPGTADEKELAAIRATSTAFVEAFNKKDATAVASSWTADGEFIDDSGKRYSGRQEIADGYAKLFEMIPDAKLRLTIDSLRLLSPTAAIEDGTAVVEPRQSGASGVSRYSVIHVKLDGKWLMASVRDTWVEDPIEEQQAADLEWLVGTWVAEDRGVQTESVCRWDASKRFLERRYTITALNGTQTSGLQIIGWNPLGGYVQSWDFSPDGGHAVGIWQPVAEGWQAELTGFTGRGIPTEAVNVLRRLDDNAYVWQSTQRRLGDLTLPDTDEVIIKRSAKP